MAALLMGAASAQTVYGPTSMDASGDPKSETAACNSGKTQQDRATCLREVRNAKAEKNAGKLGNSGARFDINAVRRCAALPGDDKIACEARVAGYGNQQGSVAGGGLLREVETVTVPREQTTITIQPRTTADTIVVIRR
jgi:hypothetical protein